MIALRSFAGARENARRHGFALPDGFEERLRARRRVRRATAAGRTARSRRSPTPTPATTRTLLELLGVEPGETDASFPDGGYFTQRSDERFLIFDCGPLGDGGHGHYDLLSFEAWAGGRPLVVDPGRYTYAEGPPNLRHWFKGTAAHNTVCVDGLDQTPYARKAPSGPAAAAALPRAHERDELVGEAHSPAYEAVHRRRVAFVDDRYWVIEDTLAGEREHRYDLRFHLPPGEAWTVGLGRARRPALALVIDGADEIAIEPGWVAPRYGAGSRRRWSARSRPAAQRELPDRGWCRDDVLAPDPAVPQRDALLDERRVAAAAGRLLDGDGRPCRRENAKYRVGESLRVVYRVEADGGATPSPGAFAGRQRGVYRRARRPPCRRRRCPPSARAGARGRVLGVPERPPATTLPLLAGRQARSTGSSAARADTPARRLLGRAVGERRVRRRGRARARLRQGPRRRRRGARAARPGGRAGGRRRTPCECRA